MWGIDARSIAVESVVFLSDVMWFLRPRLECFMRNCDAGTEAPDATASVNPAAGRRMREFYEVQSLSG